MPTVTLHRWHPAAWLRRRFRPATCSRLLHVLSSLQVGGMEQFVVRIAAAQKKRGLDVGVLALRDGPLRKHVEASGLPLWSLDCASLPRRLASAAQVMARWSPEVVHVHNTSSLQYGALAYALLGCPYLMTFHGQGKAFPRRTSRFEWSTVSLVATVSSAAREQIAQFLPEERLRVVLNGIEVSEPRHARERVRAQLGLGSQPVAIQVARIDGMKGHDDLLSALAFLRDRGRRLCVLLAGDGAERAHLEQRARDLGLNDDWVRFLGFRSDISELLEAADLFLLPSLTEGMPLSVLEGMAAGLPVVASDVGGIPEVVTHEREGLLVSAHAPEALAGALERLAFDPELRARFGAAGRARVQAEFSFERMLDRYEDLYQEIAPPS